MTTVHYRQSVFIHQKPASKQKNKEIMAPAASSALVKTTHRPSPAHARAVPAYLVAYMIMTFNISPCMLVIYDNYYKSMQNKLHITVLIL